MKPRFLYLLSSLVILSRVWAVDYEIQGEAIPLTPPGEYYQAPKWAPGGQQLAAAGPAFQGIFIIDVPTGTALRINNEPASGFGFSWSPDGDHIAA